MNSSTLTEENSDNNLLEDFFKLSKISKNSNKELKKVKQEKESLIIKLSESYVLVFYIGNILVDKNTLCNGCFLNRIFGSIHFWTTRTFRPDSLMYPEASNCSKLHPFGCLSNTSERLSVFHKYNNFLSKHRYGKTTATVRTLSLIRQDV
jgi:hypothetical protein